MDYLLPIRKTIRIRILPIEPWFVEKERTYHGRTTKSYIWHIVVRGEEKDGVKLFMMNNALHQRVIKAISNLNVMPKLTFWQKSARFLSKIPFLGFLNKYVPKNKSILDWNVGFDLMLNDPSNPIFIEVSKPAGTPEQMKQWRQYSGY